MPVISVLLPFQKEGEWLGEAIRSILHQTFRDWELLLIENGADAETLQVARQYAAIDPRIQLTGTAQHGIAAALNKGLAFAGGKYIARMDADDVNMPERFRKQFDYLERNTETAVISCMTHFHPDGNKGEGFGHYMNWQNSIISPQDHFFNRFIESPLSHPTVMFRKSLIDQFGNYAVDPIPEDYELWMRWLSKGVQFCKIPELLFLWRDHDQRLSRTSTNYSSEKFLELKVKFLSEYLLQNHPDRKYIICGAGTAARKKSEALHKRGVFIHGYTDVKNRKIPSAFFIPANSIRSGEAYYYISFVGGRGKSDEVRGFLKSKELLEGQDFIMAS